MQLSVNGGQHDLDVGASRTLLSVLREDLGLTGAKYGCGEGACGACTVLLDEQMVRSCVIEVGTVAGQEVTTAEGLVEDGRLHPVQQAFVETSAAQCGYCTPGMVLATVALLDRHPDPDDTTIRSWLQSNICRCCAYPRLERAVRLAAQLVVDAPAGSGVAPVPATPAPIERGRPRAPWDLVPVRNRDYFEVMGDGLMVVVPPVEPTTGFWSFTAGLQSFTGGAWLHIGADGWVSAFTGKVEVGQGTRQALQLAVARELGVAPTVVRVVMGDTDLCPFDQGTFGSLSMPTALPALRAAAASARVELTRRATGSGEVRLDGVAEVVIGSRDVALRPPSEWAGPDLDNGVADAVSGAKRFATDVRPPGMWHGRILRPPAPGGQLVEVDLSAARTVPGVVAIREGDIVGVAAADPATAQRALDALAPRWRDADLVGQDDLIAHLRSHPIESSGRETAFEHVLGDIDDVLEKAPIRLAHTYTTAYLAHAPLETRVALAEWDRGRLTVTTATQRPFDTRRALAEAFGIDERAVRVVVPDAGGAFGGKHDPQVAIEAATLAHACAHPVQVRWTREEEFAHGYFRPAAVIDVDAGATSDGNLTGLSLTNTNGGGAGIGCPYEIAAQRIRVQPAETPLPQGSYRALGATANHFARESMLDELARALRVDPLEMRLRHLTDDRLATVFSAAAEAFGWSDRSSEPGTGSGIAGGIEKDGRVTTCVEVRRGAEPGALEVVRVVTAFECGAVIDADNLRNQIEGATIMGLGGALFEAIRFDAYRILNPSLSDYRVPRFEDVPPIEVVLVDRPDVAPAGAGETPLVAIAPALANAMFDATGQRRRSLPLLGAQPL